ncbi:MAG: hypothetical protein IT361_10170 [Gemmatimonadaceae bacterium]|nr:hypothetical protein [Gemmatimonadaceae bacterium]
MRRHWSAALIAVAALSARSEAAERNYTIRGDGWFDARSERFGRLPMREARLTLRDDGAFAVTLFVRNERYLVRGRWDRRGRPGLQRIDISDAFGRRASGTGSLVYSGWRDQPVRLELEGRTGDGDFRASIAALDARRDEDDDDRFDFDLGNGTRLRRTIATTVDGTGTLRLSGIRDGRLGTLRLRLERDREARLEFGEPTRGEVRAEITDIRDRRITLRVREVFGRRANGELVVMMRDREQVDRINGSGGSDGGSWQLDFDARNRRSDDWNGGWGNDRDWGDRADLSMRGTGWLRQDLGPALQFDRVRVILGSDRDAEIALDGRGTTIRLRGRVSGYGNTLRVDLTDVNELRATGVVELRRDGNRLRSLEGEGRTRLGRFEVRFGR